ncbi:hypothetical protein [Bacteroides caecimuris]|uniref:hypothetical protein n=1 Tax=Bacteroides caecimuris TaxID=1796613 RepID=UPI00242AC804|nr:hypothetical protein [Bacteroides caecimuris]
MGVREDFFKLKTACFQSKGADREKTEVEMECFLLRCGRKTKKNCKQLLMKILPGFIK